MPLNSKWKHAGWISLRKLAAATTTPTSMMDISDGLSSELADICKQAMPVAAHAKNIFDRLSRQKQLLWLKSLTWIWRLWYALNGRKLWLLFTFYCFTADHEKVYHNGSICLVSKLSRPWTWHTLIYAWRQEFELKVNLGPNPLKEDKQ